MNCRKCGKSVDERSRRCSACGTELNTEQSEQFAGPGSMRLGEFRDVKRRLGRKAQVGGAIIFALGILLSRSVIETGTPGVTHRSGVALITLGALLVLAGTFARWFYLD